MEQDRRVWNTLEATVSYKARARLTPTLTHVVAYELATSGAEDRAMSYIIPSVALPHTTTTTAMNEKEVEGEEDESVDVFFSRCFSDTLCACWAVCLYMGYSPIYTMDLWQLLVS